jgi:hypothetical protein
VVLAAAERVANLVQAQQALLTLVVVAVGLADQLTLFSMVATAAQALSLFVTPTLLPTLQTLAAA